MIRRLTPRLIRGHAIYARAYSRPRRGVASTRMSGDIQLTDRESELFAILKNTLKHADLKTTLRCAGGWVRDKLLKLESDDIDIALDDMFGKEFADHVSAYLVSENSTAPKVAVIMSNPEQSKHLETARMKLLDFELDLVNLRSETYSDSRIPQISIGTPKQDAERRDLTINSLFFNINTNQVEDCTGKGLDDLKAGLIRTPLPATQTFLDDPLRILRALRFAARFGFDLDLSLQEAASKPEVRGALTEKVSRERVGVELDKMFTGNGAVGAMKNLESCGLFPAVFAMPSNLPNNEVSTSYSDQGLVLMEAAEQLLNDWEPQSGAFSKEERKQTLMAALLLPLEDVQVPLKGEKTQPLTSYLILQSIKWRNVDADCLQQVHAEGRPLLKAYGELQKGSEEGGPDLLKQQIGQSLKVLKARRYRQGIVLAAIHGLKNTLDSQAKGASSNIEGSLPALSSSQERLECCKQLEAAIAGFELLGCWDWKPLLGGKEVMDILGVKGAQVGKQVAKLSLFQLSNPRATAEDAKAFLLDEAKKA